MKVGEIILKSYLSTISKSKWGTRGISSGDYHQWQIDTSAKMFSSFTDFDFKGKRILELGCGLGGRSVWLAANGAGEVIGIDINQAEIEKANRIRKERYSHLSNLAYYPCKENERLEHVGDFDFVLLLDSLEHVISPLRVILAAREYTKPGGKVYFTTCGWYHHNGSHTGIPFASLFFSDETILNVLRWHFRRADYDPNMWDSEPPVARWEYIYDLRDRPGEYLNKISIHDMKKLIKYAPFRKGRLLVQGFRNPKLRWLNPLSHVPVINEVFHSAVVGVLEK
jgi:2-polyprenyl-3-methyl-5-hydroxy-6-metoxy-1,4-benzoquinol methylase